MVFIHSKESTYLSIFTGKGRNQEGKSFYSEQVPLVFILSSTRFLFSSSSARMQFTKVGKQKKSSRGIKEENMRT
jgi:hypothetical protein